MEHNESCSCPLLWRRAFISMRTWCTSGTAIKNTINRMSHLWQQLRTQKSSYFPPLTASASHPSLPGGTMLTILMMLAGTISSGVTEKQLVFKKSAVMVVRGGAAVIILYLRWIVRFALPSSRPRWAILLRCGGKTKTSSSKKGRRESSSYNKRSDYVKDCGGKHDDGSSPLLMTHKSARYE